MVALIDEIVTTTKEHTRVPNEQSTECTEHEVLCSSLPLRKTESEYFQERNHKSFIISAYPAER